ncbi:CNNM domain-containing protein [Bacillus marinisedimentorum]|uniref:CNNM domain-containing protein n=1 Tax=Bacillus marinisedimentorum TaxID=1821260 RepID=UPI0008726242|nr:CNNM domain-containing protein [Bacillus marinisedimentorum]
MKFDQFGGFDVVFAIIFFILVSFFLSGSETALTAVNRMKVKTRAENDDPRSKKMLKLISRPDRMITSILIGNNISNIMLPTLVTIFALSYDFNVGIATGILTIVLIIFAEVLPKTIAATFADKVAYIVLPVIAALVWVLKPITFLMSSFTNFIIKFFTGGAVQETSLSREELMTMVDIASIEGTFKNEESQRIKGAIDFANKDVRDALKTPRVEITGIPWASSFEEAREIVLNSRHTRFPVYKGNMDTIVGVFHSKQLLKWSVDHDKSLYDFTDNEPLFVGETTSIAKVFKMMLNAKKHLAIVLDEYGGTTGIISSEDIIEAMIGQEIEDETDEEEEVLIDEMTDTHIICHGKLSISRLNDVFRTRIPEEEDIIAGFLLKEFGHIPGEKETLSRGPLYFEVLEVERNKITKVMITKEADEMD